MRILVDQCLSPDFAAALTRAGHDVVHVRDFGMERAPDAEVLELARAQDRSLVSADTDFGRSWRKPRLQDRPLSSSVA